MKASKVNDGVYLWQLNDTSAVVVIERGEVYETYRDGYPISGLGKNCTLTPLLLATPELVEALDALAGQVEYDCDEGHTMDFVVLRKSIAVVRKALADAGVGQGGGGDGK